jgi:hypothetical protein
MVALVLLKLTGLITISWWWVFAPLILSVVILLVILLVILGCTWWAITHDMR